MTTGSVIDVRRPDLLINEVSMSYKQAREFFGQEGHSIITEAVGDMSLIEFQKLDQAIDENDEAEIGRILNKQIRDYFPKAEKCVKERAS